jgi:hypothetical protein
MWIVEVEQGLKSPYREVNLCCKMLWNVAICCVMLLTVAKYCQMLWNFRYCCELFKMSFWNSDGVSKWFLGPRERPRGQKWYVTAASLKLFQVFQIMSSGGPLQPGTTLMQAMAVRVVDFSNGGCKIRKIFCIRINIPKGNNWILSFGLMASCQK